MQEPGGFFVSSHPFVWARPSQVLPAALLVLLGALISGAGVAQEGLYGPEAPRDVAYLRFINAVHSTEIEPAIDGAQVDALEFGEVSPYERVEPGSHRITLGEEELTLETGPESFTTVAVLPSGPLVMEDVPLRDISRGLLTFYNLREDETASLVTSDGTAVFSDVPELSSESMPISEAEVELVAHLGGEPVAELDRRLYARGEAHSVVLLPEGTEPILIYSSADAQN